MLSNDIKEFVKKLEFTGGKYSARDTFKDVITLAVYFINATMLNSKEYAKKFDDIMKKYTINEQRKIWQILLDLINLYNKQIEVTDIMTLIFEELGLGNKNTGQFFTPTSVSILANKITLDSNDIEKDIKEEGYTTFHEPSAGAGGMILVFANELKDKGYDTYRNLYVEAWDIDVLCAYMTYLQLSMYDIPAKVINGDILLLKENLTLYTPAYYMFRQLQKEGKLTVPLCGICKKEIDGKVYTSEMYNNKKLCKQCYSTEKCFLLMKKLMK